jgi:hypothetical protein
MVSIIKLSAAVSALKSRHYRFASVNQARESLGTGCIAKNTFASLSWQHGRRPAPQVLTANLHRNIEMYQYV